jgi:competence protein ComEC
MGDEHIAKSSAEFIETERSYQAVTRHLLLHTPPLYLSTAAVIGGDALGNLHVFIPSWVAIGAAAVAAALFLFNRPVPGMAAAVLGLICAATLPLNYLLDPDFSSQTVRRFPDGALVTIEGWVVRAPEPQGGGRTYLSVDVQNGALSGLAMSPAIGLVRVTALGPGAFRVGDKVRASGKIRFPRNDGDEDEFDYRAWLMRQGIAATMVALPSRLNVPLTRSLPVPLPLGSGRGEVRVTAEEGRVLSAPSITVIGHREAFPDSLLETVRERIARFIDATLQYPENAELRALIIGDRSGIDEHLRQPFALTGMAHLLVISGLHLGLVAAGVFLLARLVMAAFPALMALGYANKIAAGTAMGVVSAYAAIAGGHVSTIRAFVMVLTFGVAILLDRSRELLASLALAALIICFAIPGSTADIGFQLSFASVGAILLGMRRFSAWWRWRYANPLSVRTERSRAGSVAEWVCGYIAVSFWAMVGTAPLTAFHFNQFSVVGLAANAVVVPIMGFGVVICGLVAAACSFIYLPLASMILIVAAKFATAGTSLARWFVRWPFAWMRTFTPTPVEMAIIYGCILLWLTAPLAGTEVLRMMRGRRFIGDGFDAAHPTPNRDLAAWIKRWRSGVAAILTVALILDAGWWTYQRFLNSQLRVTFLSVGEGDAAVIRFPGGRVMLIDGGGGFRGAFDPGERIVAPYLWSHKIMHLDYVALSHPDRDHFGGLIFIVRNFAPAQFWTAGADSEDTSYAELLDAVKTSGARRWLCDSAARPITIAGVDVRCVGPLHGVPELKHNNLSMVLRIAYGRESFLFAGDVEAKGERELVASQAHLRATVLKVPHHGSDTSSSTDFIDAVHPEVAVISLGYLNRFHFPAPEVIRRYRDDGVEVLRTDEDGAINVVAERNAYRLTTFWHNDNPATRPRRASVWADSR